MASERLVRGFWAPLSILLATLAALMFGLQDLVPIEVAWTVAVASVLGLLASTVHGLRRLRWPTEAEALARLDATMPGRPITALTDAQAVGAGDPASEAVWRAHVARMATRAAAARAVEPDLRMSSRDPFALRYVALLAFVMAVLFGSVWRVASVADLAPGGGAQALAAGPVWEGWVEPPAYTGRPSLYLNDIPAGPLDVPQGSRITLRLYGEIGALTVSETVSGSTDLTSAADPVQGFDAVQAGQIEVAGPGGRVWDVRLIPDAPPTVAPEGAAERAPGGEMRLPFSAADDYGVISGRAVIALDLPSVERRHGLTVAPDPRAAVVLDLPMPIARSRTEFTETLIENLSQHPWVGLPVSVTLTVSDAAGQTGDSDALTMDLPGRRFFDPLAGAIIEQRRDILWSRDNGARVAQVLRAASHRPEDIFKAETPYLMLRVAVRRLEAAVRYGILDEERQEEIAQALWDIAVLIEDGRLSDALERLRQAQDRLAEAIRNGATDEEIAQLMQELREAMDEYMRRLAEENQQDPDQQMAEGESMEMPPGLLEDMLQRLQELMEQGRMDEAQALLDQLRQMMENMRVTQGEGGEGGQSPGQQAMEGLADTLRQQQGLSDETFGDLQQQFGQGQQQGEGEGQGQGEEGQQPGGGPGDGNLADRQRALRDELNRQLGQLPGVGDNARDSLDRAGRAMDGAEQALRDEDFAGALDQQSEAIEALREGMRELGESMAEAQRQQGNQGQAMGEAGPGQRRDPLGREAGNLGRLGTDEQMLGGEDVYRRARELLDEIRRRSGDLERPEAELDYLRRLLDRF